MRRRILLPCKIAPGQIKILFFDMNPPQPKKFYHNQQVYCELSSEYLEFDYVTDCGSRGKIITTFDMSEEIKGPVVGLDANDYLYKMYERLGREFLLLLQFHKLDEFFSIKGEEQFMGYSTRHNDRSDVFGHTSRQYNLPDNLVKFRSEVRTSDSPRPAFRMSFQVSYKFNYLNHLLWSYRDIHNREIAYPYSWHELWD
jgi:hypothetical protein